MPSIVQGSLEVYPRNGLRSLTVKPKTYLVIIGNLSTQNTILNFRIDAIVKVNRKSILNQA
jgi:hypothetical protein